MERGAEREIEVDVEEALKLGSRLAIIGGPGSGKTTVLNHIAWALASSLLRGTDEASRKLGLSGALPVPILLPLAAYAAYRRELKPRPGVPASEYTLRTFIAKYLTRRDAIYALPEDFFTALLEAGHDVMLLLDGLDEVADEDERARVSQAVEDLVGGKDNLRAVVTCRTAAYATGRTALAAFRVITVQPLNPFDIQRHIEPMVRRAYDCIYPSDPALAKGRSDDLLDDIGTLEGERRERLGDEAEPLTVSPLMVRMLLIVHYDNRRLPPDRAELYEKAVDALIKSEHVPNVEVAQELRPVDPEVHLAMAQSLAYHLHGQGQAQGREIEDGAVRRFFAAQEAFAPHARALIAYARNRGGLLEESNARYRFIHLGFQEFLAARYLKEVVGGDEGLDAILRAIGDSRVGEAWWREPVLLLCGYTAAKSPESARALMRRLAGYGETAKAIFAAAELAGVAAAEWRNCPEAARKEIAGRIAGLLSDRELCMAASPVLRARAGRALSVLGDPRPGVGLRADGVPDIEWVDIPDDGEFIYGDKSEKNGPKKMRLPAYRISRFLVTYAQFQAFVNAEDGFRNPRWWQGLAADEKHRSAPGEQRWPYANHPRENASLYDAVAFCRWLSEKRGERISLPTEQQWEKAARGRDGSEYPWGNSYQVGYANIDETGLKAGPNNLQRMSAVGIYPQGASPYGVLDASGNVWEWCLNEYDDPAKVQLEGSNNRVVRGGSWRGNQNNARAAVRYRLNPFNRHDFTGFRVVVAALPISPL
jgi:formylglycine-generating enzyme required for sulfatase activity